MPTTVTVADGSQVQLACKPGHGFKSHNDMDLIRHQQVSFTGTEGYIHTIKPKGDIELQWELNVGDLSRFMPCPGGHYGHMGGETIETQDGSQVLKCPVKQLEMSYAADGSASITGPFGQAALTGDQDAQFAISCKLMHLCQVQGILMLFHTAGNEGGAGDMAATAVMNTVVNMEPVAEPEPAGWSVGDRVEYWSSSYKKWIPAEVTHVDGDGIQISVKPGHTFHRDEQSSKLRRPEEGEPPADEPMEEGHAVSAAHYEWVRKPGWYIAGKVEDQCGSVEEAKEKCMADPENYMGITKHCFADMVYARRMGEGVVKSDAVKDWESEVLSCQAIDYQGQLFRDRYVDDKSSFEGGLENGKNRSGPACHWKRPGRGEGLADKAGLRLFGAIGPNDLHQHGVGDCTLISAIAALAEFPNSLMKCFPKNRQLSPQGKYVVRLWDWDTRNWMEYEIDDRLAVESEDSVGPRFLNLSLESELYPCLIEKAVAIHQGGYDFLNQIATQYAFAMLTGCANICQFTTDAPDQWVGMQEAYRRKSCCIPVGFEKDGVWPDGGNGSSPKSNEEFWHCMHHWDNSHHLMAAGIRKQGMNDQSKIHGIFYMHSYSVIQVKCNIGGSGVDLAQMRNPHGQSEPELAWSDGSSDWERHPEVAQALKWGHKTFANDGLFWISKADFFAHFNTFYLCKCKLEERRGGSTVLPTRDL